MIRMLEGPERVLFVSTRVDYIRFCTEARRLLAESGRPMPPVYLWLQTRVGPPHHHQVLFGNEPPPWPEPVLDPPSAALGRRLSSQPAS
jgi:hypothetical protein